MLFDRHRMKRQLILRSVGTLLGLLGLGLFVAAQVLRAWTVTAVDAEIGLYQNCTGSSCENIDWTFDSVNLANLITRIVLIAADVFILAALITTVISFALKREKKKSPLKVAGSCNIVGGVLALLANAAYVTVTVTVSIASYEIVDYHFGYCFIFVWVAGSLFVAAGICQIAGAVQPTWYEGEASWTATRYMTTTATDDTSHVATNPYVNDFPASASNPNMLPYSSSYANPTPLPRNSFPEMDSKAPL